VLVAILKIALDIAIALPLAEYLLQDRLMFFPQPLSPARRAEVAIRFPVVASINLHAADGMRVDA